jgi:hypothetical protein
MAPWREALFTLMNHNAQRPGAYFKIPSAQVMEIGVEFELVAYQRVRQFAILQECHSAR